MPCNRTGVIFLKKKKIMEVPKLREKSLHLQRALTSKIVEIQLWFLYVSAMWFIVEVLKVALQIVGRKFYKKTKKSSLYPQSLLIFIYKTQVVESHPIMRNERFTMAQVDTNGKHSLFLPEQLAHNIIHTENTQTEFQT